MSSTLAAQTFKSLVVTVEERGIAWVSLNRPDKHNAMNPQMIADLQRMAEVADGDEGLRAVVLTGTGSTSFCAGGDLAWMQDQAANSRDGRIAESRTLADMLRALDRLSKLLIVRVNGQAFGGGLGLMAVGDITIAAEGARFAFTETKLGIIPANISSFVIRRMGPGAARTVFMHGRLFDAAEARALGLVHRVVPADALDEAVEEEIKALLKCAPGAVARAKALLHSVADQPGVDLAPASAVALADAWETEEAADGIGAFFKRAKPPWTP